jgi:hypothetical protein
VQVKTNSVTFSFWLLNKHAKELSSKSHIYVFVNLLKNKQVEFFVVPSAVVAKQAIKYDRPNSSWYAIDRTQIAKFKNKWTAFGKPL